MTVSVLFQGPRGWSRRQVGPRTVFAIADGPVVHMLTVTPLSPREGTDLDTVVASEVARARGLGETVVDEGPTTVCEGTPAHRWSSTGASTGVAIITRHVVVDVSGGLAEALYTHPAAAGDRKDALDAMNDVCPGAVMAPVVTGWAYVTRSALAAAPREATLISPDRTSTFTTFSGPLSAAGFELLARNAASGGHVIADRTEPCVTATVRRIDEQIGAQIAEVSVAYVRHIAYKYVYTRPAAHDADAEAERALTSFCRPALPGTSTTPT